MTDSPVTPVSASRNAIAALPLSNGGLDTGGNIAFMGRVELFLLDALLVYRISAWAMIEVDAVKRESLYNLRTNKRRFEQRSQASECKAWSVGDGGEGTLIQQAARWRMLR
jgi:hypothetical protein